ncbi:hypothetical protein [Streptomyces sp. NPDC058335]|uniref:hypothetical protein n=1 Tax=Streptomyces sp. NPDC058335 TaxID=3346451 RepID=UPI003664B921
MGIGQAVSWAADPAQWLPPLADARCTYAAHWVATKLRWNLTVDDTERATLTELAAGCGRQTIEYSPGPVTRRGCAQLPACSSTHRPGSSLSEKLKKAGGLPRYLGCVCRFLERVVRDRGAVAARC